MYIDNVVTSLKYDGFWYTYHMLTSDLWDMRRRDALWLIWVARQHTLHRDGRSMVHRLVDSVFN